MSSATHRMRRRAHWEIIPREGKPALVAVDVLVGGNAPAAGEQQPAEPTEHTLTVRDRAGAWTPGFRDVRDALGMPSSPPG